MENKVVFIWFGICVVCLLLGVAFGIQFAKPDIKSVIKEFVAENTQRQLNEATSEQISAACGNFGYIRKDSITKEMILNTYQQIKSEEVKATSTK
jgi:hypothetical protein